jgi:hypothetical protein
MGWHVLPLQPPERGGKTPLVRNGEHDASCDERVIRAWFARWPGCNVGIATGPSKLLVVDVDGVAGADSLHRLEHAHGEIVGMRATTGRGEHLYCESVAGVRSRANAFGASYPGIDVRAATGYVVAPPSIHENGKPYAWDDGGGRRLCIVAAELAALLRQTAREPIEGAEVDEPIAKGSRNGSLVRLAGMLRYLGLGEHIIGDVLDSVNSRQCQPPLSDSEIWAIAHSAMRWPRGKASWRTR